MRPGEDAVLIYTDGGCDPNPGIGGWAAVLSYKGRYKELSGGEDESTNNRMELTAAIKALEALKRPTSVVIRTDSQYLKNGVTSWMPAWKRNHWTRRGDTLKNVDLWKQLDILIQRHDITWEWIRGHSGEPLNERCDQLAYAEIAKRRQEIERSPYA